MEATMAATIKPSFHHVTLKTSRLGQMVDWYKTLVGTEVLFQNDTNAWTSNDAANHRLAFLAVPGLEDDPDKIKRNGIHHSAFEYASFSDLMSSFDRLREHGIMPVFCLNHGSTMSLYYEDPEGNYVRAVQRCWVGFTGSPPPHTRGEVRRLTARGMSEPVNV